MHLDVVDLRDFYSQPLGQVARRMIWREIRHAWPDVTGQRVLGLGFATPYLRGLREEAERVVAVMPAAQGVLHWPREGPNVVCLADETELPIPDGFFDRVVVVHAIENSETLRPMLREAWRVLAPGGLILIVVPNRRGIWARLETTPLGHGRPFSRGQITRLLKDTMFSPTRWSSGLFMPPWPWQFVLRSAVAWERAGKRFWPRFAGIHVIEATKQIYAASPAQSELLERARFARPFRVAPVPTPRTGLRVPADKPANI